MTRDPFYIVDPKARSRWVLTCDHASNRVPPCVNGGTLGLPPEDMARHIAWDVGAAGVTRALARHLDAAAVLSDFSRLVIDPNRGEDDPTLLMRLYDGTIIPANRHADAAERERRLDAFHRPYHRALTEVLAARRDPVVVSVHSFTPQFRGRPPRPWHVGVLFADDRRLADPLIARLRAERDICVGINKPYGGELPGDAMDRHALAHGRLHVLIELRNDLISDKAGQDAWAARLAPLLRGALHDHERMDQGETPMDDATRTEIEAAAFRRLRAHLLEDRPDVQNIDLMNLAGFCRNCLSRWTQEAAAERGVDWSKEEARDRFYGEPFAEWTAKHQHDASPETRAAFETSFAENVKT